MQDDSELLRDYLERGDEAAFRTLVERHSGMVHAAACRVVDDPHAAEEVTQAVFILLARKAPKLKQGTVLAGWLHRTARFVSLEAVRARRRRTENQHDFFEMNPADSISEDGSKSAWEQVAPVLEQALSHLGRVDHDALVLRFLEEKSFTEVGAALGASEAAAKMRVGRALEKLRNILGRGGIAIPAATLMAALTAHAASAAPPSLSTVVAGSALASLGKAELAQPVLVKAALKLMAWQKAKTALTAGVLFLFLAGGTAIWKAGVKDDSPAAVVLGFQPMAGIWNGTYESRDGTGGLVARLSANLNVAVSPNGRSCEIEMALINAANPPQTNVFRFTHTLNAAGDRITTVDDPQIGRVAGEGAVIESKEDRQGGEWRAGFRIVQPNLAGSTDCKWVVKGNELQITRRDEMANGGRLNTELKLTRKL